SIALLLAPSSVFTSFPTRRSSDLARRHVNRLHVVYAEALERREVFLADFFRRVGGNRQHDDARLRPAGQAHELFEDDRLVLLIFRPADRHELRSRLTEFHLSLRSRSTTC